MASAESEQSKEEKAMQQLSQMFSNMPLDEVRALGEENQWNVQKCLDNIFNDDEVQQTQSQPWQQPWQQPLPQRQQLKMNCATPTYNWLVQGNLKNGVAGSQQQNVQSHKSAFTPYKQPEIGKLFGSSDGNAEQVQQRVLDYINSGLCVMVLMRGPPGCGKSYLAKSLIERLPLPYNYYSKKDFILSTDDYFYDANGNYNFRPECLQDAHKLNLKHATERASLGWSPLIIDNTNMQLWEMKPYAKMALRYGYIVEMLIPETKWRFSVSTLAKKNKHNVPFTSIERIINRFEYVSLNDLYQVQPEGVVPQTRSYPPYTMQFQIMPEKTNEIKAEPVKTKEEPPNMQTTLLELLRENKTENMANEPETQTNDMENAAQAQILKRHNVNCPNENESFVMLRQIYPSKDISCLWDLFVKCQGEIKWTVDLLMREDEINKLLNYDKPDSDIIQDTFDCKCKSNAAAAAAAAVERDDESNNQQLNTIKQQISNKKPALGAKPKRSSKNAEAKVVKTMVEGWFQLNDSYYSEHVRDLRKMRHGQVTNSKEKSPEKLLLDNNNTNNMEYNKNENGNVDNNDINNNDAQDVVQEDGEEYYADMDVASSDSEKETIKVSLGGKFMEQLSNFFQAELSLSDIIPKNVQHDVDVMIPRSLAWELYLLWAESVYHMIEEQQNTTQRDEEKRHSLYMKNFPPYCNSGKTSPCMQEVLQAICNETKPLRPQQQQPSQINLAAKITLNHLSERFPDIPRDTLQEILIANNLNYNETIELISDSVGSNGERSDGSGRSAGEISGIESSSSSCSVPGMRIERIVEKKMNAIRVFEMTRNMAAHHSQLKSECQRKVDEYLNSDNCGAVLFFTEIANLHLKKINEYNHQAANCIKNVHKLKAKNPDLLDLHYLHLNEAMICLEVFLDGHIYSLRYLMRQHKKIFIITGRGLHSANGHAAIKSSVIRCLNERNLRWSEINPGLLKVKLYRNF